MSLIEHVAQTLDHLKISSYRVEGECITFHPEHPDGFQIMLNPNGWGGFTVSYDGWHEEFDNEEEAAKCFLFGLSRQCRLKTHIRGNMAYKWTVEWYLDGEWKADSTTGLIFYPYWKKPIVSYRSNELIDFP